MLMTAAAAAAASLPRLVGLARADPSRGKRQPTNEADHRPAAPIIRAAAAIALESGNAAWKVLWLRNPHSPTMGALTQPQLQQQTRPRQTREVSGVVRAMRAQTTVGESATEAWEKRRATRARCRAGDQ